MKKIWKITIVLTLVVMVFSGCGKAEAFAYKQFDNITESDRKSVV